MKKTLLLVMLSTLLFSKNYKEFAKTMAYETDYKVAIAKAKKEKKDLMFVLVTNTCGWCKKFERRTLSNSEIDKKVHLKFIALILNGEEHNFPDKFNSGIVPVVYFLNYKDEEIYEKVVGYRIKIDFLEYLK